ncbi:MAG: F0F1 ATP synthase subunit B [Anaerolineae bacterium]|nr:F0F1 ATP synthase subunit B [Anaerolineae bacterium]RIK23543.1 MAG: ATP synthase F0 subunit B [Anaerolineae bacterium]
MEALGINLGYLITQILGITALLLILSSFVYKPMLRVLDERKARIAKGLEDARQASIARENADMEAKRILDEARVEATNLRREAVVAAESAAKDVEHKAREDAKDILSNARAEATEERNRILADLRGQVAAISIAAANKLVGESLDEKRQHQLINDFFSKVPAGVSELKGDAAEITSALPLTDAEKQSASKLLGVKDVAFKVDPSILGGLVVRVGDRVVDDSVSNRMSALQESLRR